MYLVKQIWLPFLYSITSCSLESAGDEISVHDSVKVFFVKWLFLSVKSNNICKGISLMV